MKNMKKVMSGVLCAAMIASTGMGVFAAENPNVKKLVDDKKECNLYDHFDMTYDDFVAAAGSDLKAAGIELDGSHQMVYLSVDEDDYTSYAVMMHAKETSEDADYMIDFDAKSGRIHSISIENTDKAVIERQFELSLKALGADDTDIETLSKVLASEEDYESASTDKFDVDKYVSGEDITVGIECPFGSQKEEGPELSEKDKPACVKAADKLIADTKECGSEDFDVTYNDLVKVITPALKAINVDITKCAATYTVYLNDDYKTCDMSASAYSNDEDDMTTYFSIDYDKDNDKIHDIYYDIITIEDCCDVTKAVLEGLGVEAADIESTIASMTEAAEAGEDLDIEVGDYEFIMYDLGDAFDVSIYKLYE